jgi:hypothetical protein
MLSSYPSGPGLTRRGAERRRGHATAMLDHVEERVVAAGCRLASAILDFDRAASPTAADDPGVRLLLGRGYSFDVGDVQRTLRLPAPDRVLDRLAAEALLHHENYTLRSWVDQCPDELVGSYGRPRSGLPVGTLVDPGHRGRRLGLAVKVANHGCSRSGCPGPRRS